MATMRAQEPLVLVIQRVDAVLQQPMQRSVKRAVTVLPICTHRDGHRGDGSVQGCHSLGLPYVVHRKPVATRPTR
eukprot:COSAG03_NODE_1087_length_4849_cov_15.870526_7_plen_75_part_00